MKIETFMKNLWKEEKSVKGRKNGEEKTQDLLKTKFI